MRDNFFSTTLQIPFGLLAIFANGRNRNFLLHVSTLASTTYLFRFHNRRLLGIKTDTILSKYYNGYSKNRTSAKRDCSLKRNIQPHSVVSLRTSRITPKRVQ